MAMVLNSLLICGWTCDGLYDLQDACHQTFVGYYMLLMMLNQCHLAHGDHWSRHFLPKTTLKNLLFVAAHFILSCTSWDAGLAWRPCARTEAAAEHFFSHIKRPFRGQPSIKDGLLGTHHRHMQQCRESSEFQSRKRKGATVSPLSMAELAAVSEKAFHHAANFVSWISVDKAGLRACGCRLRWPFVRKRLLAFSSSIFEQKFSVDLAKVLLQFKV